MCKAVKEPERTAGFSSLEIVPCLRLSGVPLPLFYLELAVFSVFFTQTEQILLFHLVNWTCGVRSATVTQPIYNCPRSHDATALRRRNINRKLGKVTLLVGDHNTAFLFFSSTKAFNNMLSDLLKKTRVASRTRIKAANVYAVALLLDPNNVFSVGK